MGLFYTIYSISNAAGAILLGALLIGLRRRGSHRDHPAFFCYLATVLGSTLLEAPLMYPYQVAPLRYPWLYYVSWPLGLLTTFMGLVVILEVYLDVFRSYEWLGKHGTAIYRWAGAFLLLGAAFLAWQTRTADGSHAMFFMLLAMRSVRIVQTGLLVVLFVCFACLRLGRRGLSFGIAAGYGSYAAIEMILFALRTAGGPILQQVFQSIGTLDYLVPLGIWAAYVFAPQSSEQPMQLSATSLNDWNEQLGEMLRR